MRKPTTVVLAKPHFFGDKPIGLGIGIKETILKFGVNEVALGGTKITARPDEIGV